MIYSDKPAISGGWIVFALIIFFPIVFLLLLIRWLKHRDLSYHKILDLKMARNAFGFICLIMLLMLFNPDLEGVQILVLLPTFLVLLLVPSIALHKLSKRRMKQLQARYDEYRHLIFVQDIPSIYSISERMGIRSTIVKNDLLRMIYLGLIRDAFVDNYAMQLVFNYPLGVDIILTGAALEGNGRREPEAEKPEKSKPVPRTVECPGCGSNSVLQPGESKSCEYCDSALTYPA